MRAVCAAKLSWPVLAVNCAPSPGDTASGSARASDAVASARIAMLRRIVRQVLIRGRISASSSGAGKGLHRRREGVNRWGLRTRCGLRAWGGLGTRGRGGTGSGGGGGGGGGRRGRGGGRGPGGAGRGGGCGRGRDRCRGQPCPCGPGAGRGLHPAHVTLDRSRLG